jgi:quercetin dioxygenase-like cupin family protein
VAPDSAQFKASICSDLRRAAHPQDQVTCVIEGAIDFVVDGRPVRLTAGQLATLPGGVPHAANIPTGAGVASFNVFTSRERPPDP